MILSLAPPYRPGGTTHCNAFHYRSIRGLGPLPQGGALFLGRDSLSGGGSRIFREALLVEKRDELLASHSGEIAKAAADAGALWPDRRTGARSALVRRWRGGGQHRRSIRHAGAGDGAGAASPRP